MNNIRQSDQKIAADQSKDREDLSNDLSLASELLRTHLADEYKNSQERAIEPFPVTDTLTPLSPDEFRKLLTTAQEIYDKNELRAFKAKQTRNIEEGTRLAQELIAENDLILPAAQLRILDIYKIPVDTFKLAQAASMLGASQNNSRVALAVKMGLPANASREMISAERQIAQECKGTQIKMNGILKALNQAQEKKEFRNDLIDKEGFLTGISPVQDRTDVIELLSEPYTEHKPRLKLIIRTNHLEYSKDYPGLTLSEKALSWFQGFFGKGESLGETKLNKYSISFEEAYALLEEKSPAFRTFVDNLPEDIEIKGWIKVASTGSDKKGWEAGKIALESFYLDFRLKGYSEDGN